MPLTSRESSQGKAGGGPGIEGSYDLDGDLGVMPRDVPSGCAAAQLSAHNWNQNYADYLLLETTMNGLTSHGREVIHEMNLLGMVINVSHASPEATLQAIGCQFPFR